MRRWAVEVLSIRQDKDTRYWSRQPEVSGSLYLTLATECVKQATPMTKRSFEIWRLGTVTRIDASSAENLTSLHMRHYGPSQFGRKT